MSLPDWAGDVARYMLEEGLVNTLKIAVIALVGSTLAGVTLGTLLTIRFLPSRVLIRLYVEIWRGLPILVTIFIIFFALPARVVVTAADHLSSAEGPQRPRGGERLIHPVHAPRCMRRHAGGRAARGQACAVRASVVPCARRSG